MKGGQRAEAQTAKLLLALAADSEARLSPADDGFHVLSGPGAARSTRVPDRLVRALLGHGLLAPAEAGALKASDAARAWLARRAAGSLAFLGQHGGLEMATITDESGSADVLVNRSESPVAALARPGKAGTAWLDPPALAAAERLRRDFEKGRLQPRITANWSASVAQGRRAGTGKDVTDLTDMALAARRGFERAVEAVGPDLSGVLIDVCCFLKGLETVERERLWPARSAKLVLRLALNALARHYGLSAEATGRAGGRIQHWGAEGYRPEIG